MSDKKTVTGFVRSLGGTASYSGKSKTMYIKSDGFIHDNGIYILNNTADAIETAVLEKFGYSLRFKLSTNN